MKLVTWNINSLNARQDFCALFLDAEQPDILCLQELKLPDDKVPVEMFEERGYHVAFHGQPQWNGVLIASKFPITEVAKGLPEADEGQSRLVACDTAGIRLVNLYCPQGQRADSDKFQYKLRFYAALRAWIAERYTPDQPVVVVGDLNIAPGAEDIWDPKRFANTPSFHPLEHEEWGKLVGWGLTDAVKPHIEPGTYSFWDYRGGDFRFNKGMRIDHILVTRSVLPRVSRCWIERDWRKKKEGLTASDHAPVCATLEDA